MKNLKLFGLLFILAGSVLHCMLAKTMLQKAATQNRKQKEKNIPLLTFAQCTVKEAAVIQRANAPYVKWIISKTKIITLNQMDLK